MARGLLVLGTDTSVGKTVFSTLLLARMRRLGMRTAAFKPVETGCDSDPLDALTLRAASGAEDDLDTVCPYRFTLPAAPEAAARAQDAYIDPEVLKDAFDTLARDDRFVLVEAAGGAGTPYSKGTLALDLGRILDIPAVVVARATLGTVGQTLLALRAMHQARVTCAAVVLCRVPGFPVGPEEPTNGPLIEAHSALVPVLGTLPLLEVPMPHAGSAEDVRAWADRHVDVLAQHVDVTRLIADVTGP